MELDQFISGTLKGIIKGIADSQDFAKEHGSFINPTVGKWDETKQLTVYKSGQDGAIAVSTVDFDIAVTAGNEQSASGKTGINIMAFSLGGKLSDKDINQTVSKIKFSVNVALPSSKP